MHVYTYVVCLWQNLIGVVSVTSQPSIHSVSQPLAWIVCWFALVSAADYFSVSLFCCCYFCCCVLVCYVLKYIYIDATDAPAYPLQAHLIHIFIYIYVCLYMVTTSTKVLATNSSTAFVLAPILCVTSCLWISASSCSVVTCKCSRQLGFSKKSSWIIFSE